MKNKHRWKPTKYVFDRGKLSASRNPKEVNKASLLIVDLVASYYQRYLPKYAKGNLLDLGCGKVPFFELYRTYVSGVTCIDWENSVHANPFIDNYCDLSMPLPLRSESYDTIILSDVLEHLPRPELIWTEVARVCKQGCHVIINVPFYYWIHESPFDYFRYTHHALKYYAQNNGFELIKLESIGGIVEVIVDLLMKGSLRHRLLSRLVSFIYVLYKIFSKTRLGIRIMRGTRYSFPLGYFCILKKS